MLITLQKDFCDYDMAKRAYEIWRWDWEDYDDFVSKYGGLNNPEEGAKYYTDWYWYNNIGLMLKSGLLDENMLYNLNGTSFIANYERWAELIKESRVRFHDEHYMEYYEYLADRMKHVQKNRNIVWENRFLNTRTK